METDHRDGKGRFTAGNPGKPRGATHKVSRVVEALMEGQREALTAAAIAAALSGDNQALKLCLDRIAPLRRGRAVRIKNFPRINSAADVPGALASLADRVAKADLTPEEGDTVGGILSRYVQAFESSQLEARLAALEGRLK